jgi:hypothetical protein
MRLKMKKTWVLSGMLAIFLSSCGVSHCPLMRSNDLNEKVYASVQKQELNPEQIISTKLQQKESIQ